MLTASVQMVSDYRICGIFSGQGRPSVGMGKDLYEEFEEARKRYDLASEITGVDIKKLSFEGPESEQRKTENQQPLMFVPSSSIYHILRSLGVVFDSFAGYSSGEYNALEAAESFPFETGVKIVRGRGVYMGEVSFNDPPLAAVIGMERKELERRCQMDGVAVSIYSCHGNYTIGGIPANIEAFRKEVAKELDKTVRFCPLDGVSGPFHTLLYMEVAEGKYRPFLSQFELNATQKPVIANLTAQPHSEGEMVDTLVKHLYKPVLWEDSIRGIDCDEFVVMGPGTSASMVSNMIRRIRPDTTVTTIDSAKAILSYKVKSLG